jgi:hypothetical protein
MLCYAFSRPVIRTVGPDGNQIRAPRKARYGGQSFRMTAGRITHLPTLLLALLACCTNTIFPKTIFPNNCTTPNVPTSIILAKLHESAPQLLIIRNQMSTPVRLVAQRSRQVVQLEPSSSIGIPFRVLSVGSFEKLAGQPYYVRTSVTPTNHLEEIDRLALIDASSRVPEIRYRDHDGHEHVIAFDLSNCGANSGWEDYSGKNNNGDHSGQIPSPSAGGPQALCPNR